MLNEIIYKLLVADKSIFYSINVNLQNSLFDLIMPFITNFDNLKIPILLIVLCIVIWGGRRDKLVLVSACFTIFLSVETSSYFLKPIFGRARPCDVLNGIRLLVNNTKSYSFPSTHTANMFALATLLSFKYRRMLIPSMLFALLVGYSRIYVGVHYPLDVIAGIGVGFVCALLVLLLEKEGFKFYSEKFKPKYEVKNEKKQKKSLQRY